MDGISKQQYPVSGMITTIWEPIPFTSDGKVQSVDPIAHTMANVNQPIKTVFLNKRHCKHDTTDSDGTSGKTVTMPSGRSYVTGTKDSTLDVMYCDKKIRVPRGQFGKCRRSFCPEYEPTLNDSWNWGEIRKLANKQIFKHYENGYLCYPDIHTLQYSRKNPDNLPSGSWSVAEIISGAGDGKGQRNQWTFLGGGNVVARKPWWNIRIGEIDQAQYSTHRMAHHYDILKITTSSNSAFVGRKYMIKTAKACYAHDSLFHLQTLPSDITASVNQKLNLQYTAYSSGIIESDYFKLDYLELYNIDGSGLTTDSIPVDSYFDIISQPVCRPYEEQPVKFYEGTTELTKDTDWTLDIVAMKITMSDAYYTTRVANPPPKVYKIEWYGVDQDSYVSKGTMDEVRTLILNATTLKLFSTGSEDISYRSNQDWDYETLGNCAGGSTYWPKAALKSIYYQQGTYGGGIGFKCMGKSSPEAEFSDTRGIVELHTARIFKLGMDFFTFLHGLGGTIVSATVRFSAEVTKAERTTYALTSIADHTECFRNVSTTFRNAYMTTLTTLSSVNLSARVVYKQTGYWGCMNQNGVGSGACILGNRGMKGNATDVSSQCKFRLPLPSGTTITHDVMTNGVQVMKEESWNGNSNPTKPTGCFGRHHKKSYDMIGGNPNTEPSGTTDYTFDTVNSNAPVPAQPPGHNVPAFGLACNTGNPDAGGPTQFYVSNQWFGLDKTGLAIGTVTIPNDSTSHNYSLDITAELQDILLHVNDRILPGIVFESEYGIAHNSLAPNSTPVYQSHVGLGYALTGFADEVAMTASITDIIVTFTLPNSAKLFKVHCQNLPKKIAGGS